MRHVGFQISLIHLLLVQLGSSRAVTYCWVFKSDARWVGKWVRWFNLSRAWPNLPTARVLNHLLTVIEHRNCGTSPQWKPW
jgi:hypothetical protein